MIAGDEISTVDSIQNFVDRIKTLCRTAKGHSQKFVIKQVRLHNKTYGRVEFELGDLIILCTRNLAMKNISTN